MCKPRRTRLAWLVASTAVAAFLVGLSPAQERRVNAVWSYQNVREVLVVWNKGGCDQAKTTCIKRGLRVVETHRTGGYHVCKCPGQMTWGQAIKSLRDEPVIAHVEPNATIRLNAPKPKLADVKTTPAPLAAQLRRVPSDPFFGRQWNMDDIRAPQAWDCIRSSPIIVAILDSGVDYNHEDLQANMWRNPREIPRDGQDNDGNGIIDDVHGYDALAGTGSPMDANGHGTHCAGVIGAVGSNGVGVAGVAWSIQIMAVKVFDAEGTTTLNAMIKGIDYAWRHGARVVNASFAGSERSRLQRDAILRAETAGVLFVTAAGNESNNNDTTPQYPGSFADAGDNEGPLWNVISVASVTQADRLSSFSNYGAKSVHLAAPGGSGSVSSAGDIFSTLSVRNTGGYNATADGKYGYAAGTSMATPHVSAGLALAWAQNPGASARDIKNLVLSRTRKLPDLAGKTTTGGTLDLSFLCANRPREATAPPRPLLPRR